MPHEQGKSLKPGIPSCKYCGGDGFQIICNMVPAYRFDCARIEFIGSDYSMGQTQECRNVELKKLRVENAAMRQIVDAAKRCECHF